MFILWEVNAMRRVPIRLMGAMTMGILTFLSACATGSRAPLPAPASVDLDRFMGTWYVIANIPTFIEKDAYAPTETYERRPDGTIATTFSFHKGSFDGPVKTYHPVGTVRNATNTEWGMQFIWPIKAEYRIAYLDPRYSQVIIARSARDYVWVMARQPHISEADYQQLIARVAAMGYDLGRLRRVPQP
jgi:apolipoprotein D and lipocalin family protein